MVYIKKRARYDVDGGYRKLLLVGGKNAMDTPINQIIKKLKLGKGWDYARSFDNKEILLERVKSKYRR